MGGRELAERGIVVELTAPYLPSQNVIAKRFNRTLLALACVMLIKKNWPDFCGMKLWRTMLLTGFMNGSKRTRYYDASMRTIKISRNVAFNENNERGQIEYRNIPSLRAEGENELDDDSQPSTTPIVEEPIQPNPTAEEPTIPTETHKPRATRERGNVDYRNLNNPQAQPSIRSSTVRCLNLGWRNWKPITAAISERKGRWR